MRTDIVERLRAEADWLGAEVARDAADEIERLRAEVELWKERWEAERLRPMSRRSGTAIGSGIGL
jgi:hypothetical protein